MDQTKYTIETRDHEFVDLDVIRLLSIVCTLYEEEGHPTMDRPFVHFHIKAGSVKPVEFQNVVKTLMDQS